MKPVLALRHVAHESLGLLESVFAAANLEFRYLNVWQEMPERLDCGQFAGLVVLGGPMNVDKTDKYSFLAREVEWIQAAISAELPVLGICLGSQLLAKSLGARVYANGVREIGWYDLHLTPAAAEDRLFRTLSSPCTVFQWHGDTFDLPPGAVHLAYSERCRHQAFRYGSQAYGLQFHLEVTAHMVGEWLREPGNCCELAGLTYIDAEHIRLQTPAAMVGMQNAATPVLTEFAALCQENAG